jgi:hypothetical protein
VAGDPKTLLIPQSALDPAYTDISSSEALTPDGYQIVYERPVTTYQSSSYVSTAINLFTNSDLGPTMQTYDDSARQAGWKDSQTTDQIGDEVAVFDQPTGSGANAGDDFKVVWRDRNAFCRIDLSSLKGEATLDDALKLADQQELLLTASLGSYLSQ